MSIIVNVGGQNYEIPESGDDYAWGADLTNFLVQLSNVGIFNTDLVNNLTTNDSTKALAASQGVAIKASLDTKLEQANLYENAIINGDFSIDQYGLLPVTGLTNGTYYVDRFRAIAGTVTANASLETASQPSELSGSKSYKVTATSTATGSIGFDQFIEDYTRFEGKEIVLSAYVKSNNANARIAIYDGATYEVFSSPHTGGGGWERLSCTTTYTGASELRAVFRVFSNTGSSVSISTSDYIEITGVKLEIGSTPTDFMPRHTQQELALCQRYYQLIGNYYHSGYYTSGNVLRNAILIPEMRIIPTVINGSNIDTVNFSSAGMIAQSKNTITIDLNGSSSGHSRVAYSGYRLNAEL